MIDLVKVADWSVYNNENLLLTNITDWYKIYEKQTEIVLLSKSWKRLRDESVTMFNLLIRMKSAIWLLEGKSHSTLHQTECSHTHSHINIISDR